MDDETESLIKQVEQATGWHLTAPDLTSHLLEKLPAYLNEKGHRDYFYMGRAIDGAWLVAYQRLRDDKADEYQLAQEADTPLKALLNLTLELKKENLL